MIRRLEMVTRPAILALMMAIVCVVIVNATDRAFAQIVFHPKGDSGSVTALFEDPLPPSQKIEIIGEDLTTEPDRIDASEYDGSKIFEDSLLDEVTSGDWLRNGGWYFDGSLLVMHRTSAPKQVLTQHAFVNGFGAIQTVSPAMTAASSGFGYEPGARLTLGKFLHRDDKNRDHSVEFTFMGMNEWATSHLARASTGGFFLVAAADNNAIGFTGADTQEYRYKTNLLSYELNLRVRSRTTNDRLVPTMDGRWERQVNPGPTKGYLVGFRLISVNEKFEFLSRGTDPTTRRGDYDLRTNNDMFGVQVGGEWRETHADWNIGAVFKAGALVNFADHRRRLTAFDGGSSNAFDQATNDEHLTFMGDLSIIAAYQLRPNITFQFAYDLLYLQGLALAPEQLTFNTGTDPQISFGSFGFYQGASFGFTVVY